MEALKRCYWAGFMALKYVQPVFLLAIRVLVGLGFILAGWGKLTNVEDAAAFFAGLHIPMPTLNAYMAGTAETVGGALLILGAASRVGTIPLVGTMVVAYATAHKEIFDDLFADPNSFVKEFTVGAADALPDGSAGGAALRAGPVLGGRPAQEVRFRPEMSAGATEVVGRFNLNPRRAGGRPGVSTVGRIHERTDPESTRPDPPGPGRPRRPGLRRHPRLRPRPTSGRRRRQAPPATSRRRRKPRRSGKPAAAETPLLLHDPHVCRGINTCKARARRTRPTSAPAKAIAPRSNPTPARA